MNKLVATVWICVVFLSLLFINPSSVQASEPDWNTADLEQYAAELTVGQLVEQLNNTQVVLEPSLDKSLTDHIFEFETNPFETPCLPSYVCAPTLECKFNERTSKIDCSSTGLKCELGCPSQK